MFTFGLVVGALMVIVAWVLPSRRVSIRPIKDGDQFVCPDIDCGLKVISNNSTYLRFLAAEHVEYHELTIEDQV